MKYGSSYQLRLCTIILAGIVLRVWFWNSTHLVLEDALITFRYADNLAGGNGFVYNAGEKILGTTTPLWTLILATGKLFGFDLFSLCNILNIFLDSLTCWLMASILSRYAQTLALLWALLFTCAPDIIPISMSGMETSLLLFAMSLTLWGAVRKNWFFVFGIMVALMTRMDSAIWIACVIGCGLFTDRRWFLIHGLTGFLLCLPWAVFSRFYFGTLIPESLAAKMTSYHFDLKGSLLPFLNYFTPVLETSFWKLIVKNLTTILMIAGLYRLIREKGWLILFPLFFITYCLLFIFSGRLMFTWYIIPAIFCWLVFVATGIQFFGEKLFHRFTSAGVRYPIIGAALMMIIVAHTIFLEARTSKYREEQECNETVRKRIGLWLHAHAGPGSVVLLEPLGYIGYYAGDSVRIYDEIGLVSPEVLSCQKSGSGWYGSILQNVRPDFVVQYSYALDVNRAEGTGRPLFAGGEDKNRFYRDYQPAARFDFSDRYLGIEAKEKKFFIFRRGGSPQQLPPESFSALSRGRQ